MVMMFDGKKNMKKMVGRVDGDDGWGEGKNWTDANEELK